MPWPSAVLIASPHTTHILTADLSRISLFTVAAASGPLHPFRDTTTRPLDMSVVILGGAIPGTGLIAGPCPSLF